MMRRRRRSLEAEVADNWNHLLILLIRHGLQQIRHKLDEDLSPCGGRLVDQHLDGLGVELDGLFLLVLVAWADGWVAAVEASFSRASSWLLPGWSSCSLSKSRVSASWWLSGDG